MIFVYTLVRHYQSWSNMRASSRLFYYFSSFMFWRSSSIRGSDFGCYGTPYTYFSSFSISGKMVNLILNVDYIHFLIASSCLKLNIYPQTLTISLRFYNLGEVLFSDQVFSHTPLNKFSPYCLPILKAFLLFFTIWSHSKKA